MILLDTHIWVWWVNDPDRLKPALLQQLDSMPPSNVFVSAISCWEVAKLVEKQRLRLPESLTDWFDKAINRTGLTIIDLEIPIVVDACNLPGSFHNDPADQLIVATSRVKNIPLLTEDGLIVAYEYVILYTP